MPVVLYPDARLAVAASPRPVDDLLRATGGRLLAAATERAAYGLAATHIGEVEPVVVVSLAADPGRRDYRLLFNPSVVKVAPQSESGIEGSVSLPGVEVPVLRPVWAEIAFADALGAPQALRLEGWPARIALHEIEQMQGLFFLERVSRLKRDMVLRKWRKRSG